MGRCESGPLILKLMNYFKIKRQVPEALGSCDFPNSIAQRHFWQMLLLQVSTFHGSPLRANGINVRLSILNFICCRAA